MNVLFVPSLGLDVSLLERLADSIDYPINYKIALNNGTEDALEKFGDDHPDWTILEPATGNLGVSGSWNYAAKLFPDESILIVNEDAWFLPGQLEKICKCANANPNEPIIYLNSSQAYYCFVWHPAGREQIGLFDPNFFPGYYDDCDYRVRMRLKGITKHVYALEGEPVVPHGKPRTGGVNYSAMIQGCGLINRTYWQRKWGNLNLEEALYQTPYKDQRLTIKDIIWYPEHRAKLYPLWEAFLSLPNPSIYE